MMVRLAFDPPRGWSVWADGSLYAAGQVDGAGLDIAELAVAAALAAAPAPPASAAVEVPYGLGDESNVHSMLKEAESAGVIRGMLLAMGIPVDRVSPSEWRSEWRFPGGLNRDDCKELAHKLAASCVSKSTMAGCTDRVAMVGPRSGKRPDTWEAICIGGAIEKRLMRRLQGA